MSFIFRCYFTDFFFFIIKFDGRKCLVGISGTDRGRFSLSNTRIYARLYSHYLTAIILDDIMHARTVFHNCGVACFIFIIRIGEPFTRV